MAKAQAQKSKKGPDFFSKVAKLKKGAKIGILVGGLVAMAAGFYALYFTPWQQQTAALRTEVEGLNASITTEQTNINKHKPIADYVVPVSNTYSFLKNYLTTDDEIPKLMQIVNDLGSQSGATVTLFAPKAAVPKEDYAEIQFTLNLEGPFLNILKFFYSLSQMERLINITSVSMDNPILRDNARLMFVTVRCEASTYRTLNPGEAAPAK